MSVGEALSVIADQPFGGDACSVFLFFFFFSFLLWLPFSKIA
jgi:hypothetical protein